MSNFARIIDNVAVDVSVDPQNSFHPDIAVEFVAVPDDVQVGWVKDAAGKWNAPAPAPVPVAAVTYPKVGPIHFQMLFTPEEAITADGLKATDKVLASFWKLIDDPRTDVVDLGLQSVQSAIEYTLTAVSAAIVAGGGSAIDVPARKAAIVAGVLQ
jgi:hypothetical protein